MTKLQTAISRLKNEKWNGVTNYDMLSENCYLWREEISTDEPDELLAKVLDDNEIELSKEDFKLLSDAIYKDSLGTQSGYDDSVTNYNFAY